jgi:SAM-dependent methyltransferase
MNEQKIMTPQQGSSLLKRAVKRVLHRYGYQLVAIPNWALHGDVSERGGYRLVNWNKGGDGAGLAAYRQEQEKGNRAKINQVWTNENNLRFLAQWLMDRGSRPQMVVCHGTRNGFEQRILHDCFQCEVVGTEISSTASQFPRTIQADFHEVQPQWDQKVDIVYSNSLDHAYDPAKALRAWAQSVRNGGLIVLDKASDSDPHGVSDLDPFGIALPNLLLYVLEALGEQGSIRALLNVPQPKDGTTYHRMIVIRIDRARSV